MSNISQNIAQPQSLQYSLSSSGSNQRLNHDRLTDSLQYLDRIRSVNKKVFDSISCKNVSSFVSPLEKLVHSNRQITYIDNQKLYGIVKVQNLTVLKSKVEHLESQHEKYKQVQQQLQTKNLYLNQELSQLKNLEKQLSRTVQQLQRSLEQENNLRILAEQKVKSISDELYTLLNQKMNDSKRYLALKTEFEQYKAKNVSQRSIAYAQLMVCETQTQLYKPSIEISPFEPNLEEILRKLRQKQGQKVSRPTLKEIVAQSLDVFVKELDSQYKFIHEQTIDLTHLKEKNQQLVEQNISLKKKLEQIEIQEEKLKIFKSCMTEFLQDTSQNVSKSIEGQRIRRRIYEQLSEQQRNLISEGLGLINEQADDQKQSVEAKKLRLMKQNMEHLKKQNLSLIKTIGEYQYKWKNVQKVLDQNKKEEIPDDGTIGQLVRMSKLVKDSIKNLLHQL